MAVDANSVWLITPKPVFCVKFKDKHGEKVFLNMCVCKELPPPALDLDEEELASLIESKDTASFKIPLSVGEVHQEADKSGETCVALELIFNADFYEKRVAGSELFRTLLLLVAMDAVSNKHGLTLEKESWVVLKNRKAVGNVGVQNIRQSPLRPMVELLKEESGDEEPSEVAPPFRLLNRVQDDKGLVEAEIRLQGVLDIHSIDLQMSDIGVFVSVKNRYRLNIAMPVQVDPAETTSDFDRNSHVLRVHMPCSET